MKDQFNLSDNISAQIRSHYQQVRDNLKEVIEKPIENLESMSYMKNQFGLILTVLTYIMLIVSEIAFHQRLHKYVMLERLTMKLKDISKVWSENEGKWIYLQGYMRYSEKPAIHEEYFGMCINAPILRREVHMLQWQEMREARIPDLASDKPIADQGMFKYSYVPVWSTHLIDSSQFQVSN